MQVSAADRETVFRGVQVSDKFGVGRKKADASTGLLEATAPVPDGTEENPPSDEDEDPILTDLKKEDKEGKGPCFWMELHPKA